MFARITYQGIGGRDRKQDLTPKAQTTITLPSQEGKSTLLRALCLLLVGCEPGGQKLDEAATRGVVREVGGQATRFRATVEGITGRGSVLRREWPEKGTPSRYYQPRGQEAADVSTEAKWSTTVYGASLTGRLIIAPLAWVALAEGEGRGRPLRDLLAGLVPDGCNAIVRESRNYRDGDPVTPKGIEDKRREAGRAKDASAATQDEAARNVEEAERPLLLSTPEDADHARHVVETWERWEAHQRLARAAASWQRWQASVKALGDCPPRTPDAHVKESADLLRSATTRVRDRTSQASGAESLVETGRRQVERLSIATPAAGTSPRMRELEAAIAACEREIEISNRPAPSMPLFSGVRTEGKPTVNRYYVEDDPDDPNEWRMLLVDSKTGKAIHHDCGEPEDNSFNRDWSWVPELLNRLASPFPCPHCGAEVAHE